MKDSDMPEFGNNKNTQGMQSPQLCALYSNEHICEWINIALWNENNCSLKCFHTQ